MSCSKSELSNLVGGFIVGNVPPGNYVVMITGNQGDSAQTTLVVE